MICTIKIKFAHLLFYKFINTISEEELFYMDEKETVYFSNVINNIADNKVGDNFGITKEYDRSLYDSQKARNVYKDKIFGDKQTYHDPISGKTLHKSQNAAQNKYHMKNKCGENISKKWAEYSAEIDHIIALENLHKRVKNNPFLTNNDLKEIANIKDNCRISSKKYNASKGKKSDFSIVCDKNNNIDFKGRKELLKGKIKAEVVVNANIAGRTLKNAGKIAVSAALEPALITLAVSGINNLVDVANGKKTVGEAVKDVAVNTVSSSGSAAVGAIIKRIAESSIGRKIPIDMLPSAQIAAAAMTTVSVVKYLNGEISGEDCALEILKGNAGMLAFQIGAAFGPVGIVVSTLVVSQICGTIMGLQQKMRAEKAFIIEREKELNRIVNEGLIELERQKQRLSLIIDEEFKKWDKAFEYGFDKTISSIINSDLNGMSEGINVILGIFNQKCEFSNLEEFDDFFFDSSAELIF